MDSFSQYAATWEANQRERERVRWEDLLERACHPCNAESDKNVCTDAVALVEGHRGADYGHPSVDLGRTAKLWTALMDFEFTACDVAQMMRMVKESRLRNSPRHRDSLVDIAGYARTQEMIWEADNSLDNL